MTTIDDAIAEHEAKIAKLKTLKSALEDTEIAELAREILNGSARPANNGGKPSVSIGRQAKSGKSVERVKAFLGQNGHESSTIMEIVNGTGLTAPNVRRIIYTAHKTIFEKLDPRPGSRESLFKLKTTAK